MKTRILSIFLTAVMLIGIIPLSACGKKEEPKKSKVDHVYKATELDIGGKVYPNAIVSAGGKVLIYGSEVISEDPYEYAEVLIDIDPQTGEFTKSKIELDENSYVQKMAADGDGNVILLIQSYDSETDTQDYTLAKLEGTKPVTIKENLASVLDVSDRGYFYIYSFAVDGDGNSYLNSGSDDGVTVLDKNCNKLFELEIDGYMNDIGTTTDGRVYVSYRDRSSRSDVVRYIDTAKKDFGDSISLPDDSTMSNAKFYVGTGYDIYYKNSGSIYGFNANDAEPTELLNFVNSDIDPDSIDSFAIIDADNMICNCYNYSDNGSSNELLLLKRIPEDEIPEKYVIRLGYRSNGGGSLDSLVVKFNRASDEYRIELVDYTKYETNDTFDNDEKQLENELLAGTAPDIIALNDFASSNNWISQGAFTDLNELIEKDESFNRADYFESVLNSCTDEKGRMFRFVISFELQTILANGDYIDFDSWDAAKFIDFVSNIPEGKYLANYFSRQMMLYLPLACSMDSFIDYKKATCSFDSDLFKKLLEITKNTPESFRYYETLSADERRDYDEDMNKPYRDGTILLDTNNGYISAIDSYALATVAYGEGKKVVFLGYPTSKGNGAIMQPETSFAITDKSLLKEGAWEFIKSVSSEKTTRRAYWGFPSNISLFDAACEDNIGHWDYYTSNSQIGFGNNLTYEEVLERLEDFSGRHEIGKGVLVQTTQEHVDGLKELINGAQALPNLQGKVFEIINEEAEMYYSGAKSLDETAKIIQGRVSNYIAEIS